MDALQRARLSLQGLSVGDAFGENFFAIDTDPMLWRLYLQTRKLPPGTWRWTDDSEMACAVVEVLAEHKTVDPDELAANFGARYAIDDRRGYGGTAHRILQRLSQGQDWRVVARDCFDGTGSMGNGGAMRSAPVGAFFADAPPERIVAEATRSAGPTHAHPEGQAGAIAVALAAAIVARDQTTSPQQAFDFVLSHTPKGLVHENVRRAAMYRSDAEATKVARLCGNGSNVTAPDTAGYALWCALHRLDDFTEAMWTTVAGSGDIDTNCAIVGGIVSLRAGVPAEWVRCREPLRLNIG